jgi:hypothetical protein
MESPDFLAAQWMNVVDATLGSSDMQTAAAEVNLIPTQAAYFRGTKPMAVRDQYHGGVAVPVTGTLPGSFLEPFNFSFG